MEAVAEFLLSSFGPDDEGALLFNTFIICYVALIL
jgi:hypothetical protein